MRQFAAFFALISFFVVLVGTRFHAGDGERLLAIVRIVGSKLRDTIPAEFDPAVPIEAVLRKLPRPPAQAVRDRIKADKRFATLGIVVTGEGGKVRLRGIVPDLRTCAEVTALAETTIGVESVINELAVPVTDEAAAGREQPSRATE